MLHKSFAVLLFSIILFSCNKDEQVDLSTLQTYHNVAIPLVSAEIDVEDMLEGDTGNIISTGNNGELFLAYVTPTTTINAGEIVDIPDQSFSVSVNLLDKPRLKPGDKNSGSIKPSEYVRLPTPELYFKRKSCPQPKKLRSAYSRRRPKPELVEYDPPKLTEPVGFSFTKTSTITESLRFPKGCVTQ